VAGGGVNSGWQWPKVVVERGGWGCDDWMLILLNKNI